MKQALELVDDFLDTVNDNQCPFQFEVNEGIFDSEVFLCNE